MIADPVQPFKATIKYSIPWLVQVRRVIKCFVAAMLRPKSFPEESSGLRTPRVAVPLLTNARCGYSCGVLRVTNFPDTVVVVV